MTATGAISSRMPGGWTNAKPWYGTLPEISRIAPPRYTPSSYSVTPVRKSGLLSMKSRRASESPVAARMTSPTGDSQYARSTSGRNTRAQRPGDVPGSGPGESPAAGPSGTTEVGEASLGLLGLPFTGCAPLALQMVRDAMVAQLRGNVRGGADSEGCRFPDTPSLTKRRQDSTDGNH